MCGLLLLPVVQTCWLRQLQKQKQTGQSWYYLEQWKARLFPFHVLAGALRRLLASAVAFSAVPVGVECVRILERSASGLAVQCAVCETAVGLLQLALILVHQQTRSL